MNPLISIIVPVYNVEKYIQQCIESILNQTYKQIEVILIDDGSLDSSGVICEEYAFLDPRVTVIHKENGGLSSARNVGLDKAKGKFIGFVDSDDWIDSRMYESMLHLALTHQADVVQCGYTLINEQGKITREIHFGDRRLESKAEVEKAYYKTNEFSSVVWNKLYKADLFEELRFKVGKNNEDVFILTDAILHIQRMVNTPKCYYHYLQRKESIMGTSFTEKKFDRLEAGEYLLQQCLLHSPQYENWARMEVCKICIFLYIDLMHSKNQINPEYKTKLVSNFNLHFRELKGSSELKQAKLFDKILIYSFSLNKAFTQYSYDFYRLVRG
ncbi:MAG: glycosyltransferase [Desemzia incerta]